MGTVLQHSDRRGDDFSDTLSVRSQARGSLKYNTRDRQGCDIITFQGLETKEVRAGKKRVEGVPAAQATTSNLLYWSTN